MIHKNTKLLTTTWVFGLLVLGAIADKFLPYAPTFPYFDSLLPSTNLPRWIYSWANFDGVHYLTIVDNGYKGTGLIQAFFPMYPVLSRLLFLLLNNAFLSLWLVNLLALGATFWVWHKLFSDQRSTSPSARWSWFALLLFPTSFFFLATYTESLFLLLVLLSFWQARQKNWGRAVAFAAAASATKIIGVFLVPALMVEAAIQYLEETKNLKLWLTAGAEVLKTRGMEALTRFVSLNLQLFSRFFQLRAGLLGLLSLGSVGLLFYMTYLWREFGDPLYFYHVQSEFGAGRQESLVLLPQVAWRYIKILLTYRPIDLKYYAFVQEAVISLGTLLILLFGFWKVRTSYVVFSLMAWLLPTLTGTFSSMPRYVLVCFPIFLIIGSWLQTTRWKWLVVPALLIWLCFNTVLFIQGYWVA